jgi:hypothetical protein
MDSLTGFFKSALRAVGQKLKSDEDRRKHALRRKADYHHRNTTYPYSSYRQHERYAKNKMDEQQRNSHKLGTVQPFGHPKFNASDD